VVVVVVVVLGSISRVEWRWGRVGWVGGRERGF
jgi:hypothetical protein